MKRLRFFYKFMLFIVITILIFTHFHNKRYKYTVVTGASSNHELSIIQFLYFIQSNNTNVYIIIWDLGFSNWFRILLKKIISKSNNMMYLYFNYSNYPSYFNINKRKGEYAWKPLIINISFYKMKRTTLWLDSGCIVCNSLRKVFNDIEKYKVWSVYSCGNISTWTHIGMIKYFNITTNITKKRTCAGGLVGFKWNSKIAKRILKEWVMCSYHKECIAPNGSNRVNHRQDQSALSILLYKYNIFEKCPINVYSIKTHRDIHNITYFNKLLMLLNKIMFHNNIFKSYIHKKL